MKRFLMVPAVAVLLSACAQAEIGDAEKRARLGDPSLSVRGLEQFRTLRQLGDYAQNNAFAYADAANKLQTTQDIASLIVIGAAGTAVSWAAEGVSNGAVGRVATAGAAAEIGGRRFAARQAIQGVLTGAKRLNCVAFHSHVLDATSRGAPPVGAAEATRAAIIHIQLKTREALVREQATFEAIFEEFSKDRGLAEGLVLPSNPNALESHVENLAKCVKETSGELPDDIDLP